VNHKLVKISSRIEKQSTNQRLGCSSIGQKHIRYQI
jgi:hypothetical protein